METCIKCNNQVRWENNAWVDNSEGDACDDGALHTVSLDAAQDYAGRKTGSYASCTYVLDGFDTDGTPWHACTTHDATAISPDAPCDRSPESGA